MTVKVHGHIYDLGLTGADDDLIEETEFEVGDRYDGPDGYFQITGSVQGKWTEIRISPEALREMVRTAPAEWNVVPDWDDV
jgi:hypothetical protein